MSWHDLATAVVAAEPPAASIPPSCLHAVFRGAEEHERRTGVEVIKLHVGEPCFAPPSEVTDEIAEAMHRGDVGYTSAEGLLDLREALVEKLAVVNGVDSHPDRVFVTPGSCQGLAALMQSMATPAAELLLPELHWPIHLQQCLLAGLRPAFYPLDERFHPDLDRIEAAASANTRAILVNSPSNPAGAVLTPDETSALVELARRRGWRVISDEAYEQFVYSGEHVPLGSLERDVPPEERIVDSAYTFSKGAAMTGLRLGYIVTANARSADALRVVQEASIVAPATPVQHGGLAALKEWDRAAKSASVVGRNRDGVLPRLCEAGLLRQLPEGGWYALLDVSPTGMDGHTFAERLLAEQAVSVAPAEGFALRPELDMDGRVRSVEPDAWSRHLVRIAFCGDPERLATGVGQLVDLATTLRRGTQP